VHVVLGLLSVALINEQWFYKLFSAVHCIDTHQRVNDAPSTQRWYLSVPFLVEFHQHATSLDVKTCRMHPKRIAVSVDHGGWTGALPPAAVPIDGTVAGRSVVVAVYSWEHHPVGDPVCLCCHHHHISGVSAVPVDRQLVLTNLVTDGECHVFSPVPLTVSTMNLPKATRLCTTCS